MPLHGNGNRLCKDDLRDFEVDVLIYGDSKLVINKITVDLARYEITVFLVYQDMLFAELRFS
jgi:hypothetical protein